MFFSLKIVRGIKQRKLNISIQLVLKIVAFFLFEQRIFYLSLPSRKNKKMEKILALWAVPRSTSTAFERMMRERGDFWVVDEPFGLSFLLQ